jgi:hypothetical protein
MPDIFLSYTREDQAAAQRFAEAFEAQGLSGWCDVTLSGPRHRLGDRASAMTKLGMRAWLT